MVKANLRKHKLPNDVTIIAPKIGKPPTPEKPKNFIEINRNNLNEVNELNEKRVKMMESDRPSSMTAASTQKQSLADADDFKSNSAFILNILTPRESKK